MDDEPVVLRCSGLDAAVVLRLAEVVERIDDLTQGYEPAGRIVSAVLAVGMDREVEVLAALYDSSRRWHPSG